MGLGIAAAVLWGAAIFRFVRVRQRPHSRSLRAMAFALLALALATTMTFPPAANAINWGSHWSGMSGALKEIGIAATAAAVELMVSFVRSGPALTRRAVRVRCWVAAAVAIASLVLLVPAGSGVDFSQDRLSEITGAAPWIAESRLLVTAYGLIVLTRVVVLCVLNRTSTALGRGVGALGLGAGVMVAYCVVRGYFLVSARYFTAPASVIYHVGTMLASVGLALIAIGTVWSPVEHWIRFRRAWPLLRPLWSVFDGVGGVGGGIPPTLADAEAKLDYRVVQIQDALYLLAIDMGVPSTGHNTDGIPNRATDIAKWVAYGAPEISMDALTTPDEMTDTDWVLTIARAYRATLRLSGERGEPQHRILRSEGTPP